MLGSLSGSTRSWNWSETSGSRRQCPFVEPSPTAQSSSGGRARFPGAAFTLSEGHISHSELGNQAFGQVLPAPGTACSALRSKDSKA